MGEHKRFFETLPGILTGLAGLITAVVALIYALTEIGLIGANKVETTSVLELDDPVHAAPAPNPIPKPVPKPASPAQQTTDGWAIIGFYRQGKFADLKLMVHGDSPAIGRRYDVVDDFRLIHKPRAAGEAVITLGMVRRGDSVEVLDIVVEPGRERVPVHAKLRAVLRPQ